MLARIEQQLPNLSHTERRVGSWVLAHPRQVADSTLAEVALAAGASQPSVIRFCRKVGLSGFRDLTLRLVESISAPVSYVHRDVQADDASSDAVTKVVDSSIQSLIDLRSLLSAMPIEKTVAVMRGARQIVFAGLGASGHVALDVCHKFFRLGTPCSALTDTPSLLQFSAIAEANDVIIFLSHSGRWSVLSDASALANGRGASTVAVTDPTSPLAENAEILIACSAVEDSSVYTPMTSRLVQLVILDALHVSLALAMGETAISRLRRTKVALTENYLGAP